MIAPNLLADLAHDLRKALSGDVLFDETSRTLYSTDASNYQIMPLGVVIPRNTEEVLATHQIAARYGVPLLPRGGGSSLAGQTVGAALVLDFSKYLRRVTAINAEARTVRVQAGMALNDLNKQLAPLGLMYGPDPASASRATVGGVIGNNSTGAHSILYGMTSDHVRALEVVLADGSLVMLNGDTDYSKHEGQIGIAYRTVQALLTTHAAAIKSRYPQTWRTCAGYALNRLDPAHPNLANLLVGSEGTLATTLEAELGLVPRPKLTQLAIVHFTSLRASLEATPTILETSPSSVELIDKLMLDRTRETPEFAKRLTFVNGDPAVVLIVEYYGETEADLVKQINHLKDHLLRHHIQSEMVIASSAAMQNDVWTIRKAGLNLTMGIKGDHKPSHFIEDAAVTVDKLADYVDAVDQIVRGAGTTYAIYAHASAGCLHIKPLVNLKTAAGLKQYRQIGDAVAELVVKFGGTTSGEHGEGLVRGCFSEKVFGATLVQAFRELKASFDPDGRMNPGKMIDTPQMDDPRILRYGTTYQIAHAPAQPRYAYLADESFAGAVEQCNGSGECRKTGSGVMCPSFMATRDEKDSTRGRANMLRLAMQGRFGADGIGSQAVHEVLDLCLSCKACKSECPSSVDLAKLKAEATAAYHDQHGIPLRSRMFGGIAALNQFGAILPGLANRVLDSAPTRIIFNRLGIAPKRTLPHFAAQTFRAWWENRELQRSRRPIPSQPRPEVVLFDDTFLNYNTPSIGQAAVTVLDAAGFRVVLVDKRCCGRPAISKGLLDQAKVMAQHNLSVLIPYARRGVPIVGCEPSCVSALIDDYRDLLPGEVAEQVASQTYTLDEFLSELAAKGNLNLRFRQDLPAPHFLYHGHCHQKALTGTESVRKLLELIPGATVNEIQSGCCGVAGSFGYEAEHYDLSIAIAEDRLFPALRAAPAGVQIIASGTSCREQITHGTDHNPIHPIEALANWIIMGQDHHPTL